MVRASDAAGGSNSSSGITCSGKSSGITELSESTISVLEDALSICSWGSITGLLTVVLLSIPDQESVA